MLMKEIVIKWGIQMESFTPKITSPKPQCSKNWFGLVKNCKNLLNQIEKNSLEMPFGLVCQKDFGRDCKCIYNRNRFQMDLLMSVCHFDSSIKSIFKYINVFSATIGSHFLWTFIFVISQQFNKTHWFHL